jgi:hypothetical protein
MPTKTKETPPTISPLRQELYDLEDKMNELIHISTGGPTRKISVNGKIFTFEMHPHCGPVILNKSGDPSNHQQPKHFFWHAVTYWAQQEQRITDGLCTWDHPPEPITKRLDKRNQIITGWTQPRPGN